MRVITGEARGRRLKEPAGMDIRPTTDKVKESMFNIIQFDIEGRNVLDLFGGSGQLGIEALSRGAESAVFVDNSQAALKLIAENLKTVGLEDRARVVKCDAISFLSSAGKYGLILLDPPYNTDLIDRAIQTIIRFDKLKENGIIVCESKVEKNIHVDPPYYLSREYKYGNVKITVFSRGADKKTRL